MATTILEVGVKIIEEFFNSLLLRSNREFVVKRELNFFCSTTFHIQYVCLYMKELKTTNYYFQGRSCLYVSIFHAQNSFRVCGDFFYLFTSNNLRRINFFCVHISHKVKNKLNQFSYKRITLKWCTRGIIMDLIYASRVLLGSGWPRQKKRKNGKAS